MPEEKLPDRIQNEESKLCGPLMRKPKSGCTGR